MTVGASRSGELPLPAAAPHRSRGVATPSSLPVLSLALPTVSTPAAAPAVTPASTRPTEAPSRTVAARPRGLEAPQLLDRYRRYAVASDAGAAVVAGLVAMILRFGFHPPQVYLAVTMAVPAAWIALVSLQRGYEARFLGTGPEEYRRTTIAAMALFIVIAVVSFVLRHNVSRVYVLVVVPGLLLLSLGGRHLLRTWIYRLRRTGQGVQRVLVVGRADA